jgi:hypothetical protein
LNVSASALRRQWAQGKASAVAQSRGHRRQLAPVRPGVLAENNEHPLGYVIRAARLPWVALLAKHVAGDNPGRALIIPEGRRELQCLLLQSMARDKGNLRDGGNLKDKDNPRDRNNRSAARKKVRKEHLHQGHNNSRAIFTAAPETNPGAAFFYTEDVSVVAVLVPSTEHIQTLGTNASTTIRRSALRLRPHP